MENVQLEPALETAAASNSQSFVARGDLRAKRAVVRQLLYLLGLKMRHILSISRIYDHFETIPT